MKASDLIFTCLFYIPYVFSSNLYKWVDENGNTHYGDERPAESSHKVEEVELQPLNSFEKLSPKNIEEPKILDKQNEVINQVPKEKISKIEPTHCFAPSPLANDTPLHRIELTKSQHKSLRVLLSDMAGSWRGQAVYFDCKGQTSAPKIEKQLYTTSADIRLKRSKELIIKFEMYSSK